ncbi:uncharacterized protein LOC126964883 [Leptidea sinapis]|uniref:Uncharacterized protein n=1 Tax=Leptidea sinapis TaxID=189913 RepID=A0A5E4QVK4_9NEOP|nr:uncharacterized protein LOC126964883 [Leptidea sinapis]VVD00972.1 unnamed protein product [Leptidea sinapis]
MGKEAGNDAFQRINYLYQISKEVTEKNPALGAYYNKLIINVAKKNVLKIHPDIKKQLCKKCHALTSIQLTKLKCKNNVKYIPTKCKICNMERNFIIDKKKDSIWLDRPEAVLKIIN